MFKAIQVSSILAACLLTAGLQPALADATDVNAGAPNIGDTTSQGGATSGGSGMILNHLQVDEVETDGFRGGPGGGGGHPGGGFPGGGHPGGGFPGGGHPGGGFPGGGHPGGGFPGGGHPGGGFPGGGHPGGGFPGGGHPGGGFPGGGFPGGGYYPHPGGSYFPHPGGGYYPHPGGGYYPYPVGAGYYLCSSQNSYGQVFSATSYDAGSAQQFAFNQCVQDSNAGCFETGCSVQ